MIVAWICIVVGAYGVLRSLRAILRGVRSKRWPAVQGTVRKSKVTENTNSEGETAWRVDVEYAYHVHGKALRAKRVRFGLPLGMAWLSAAPEELRNAPRSGDRVTVVYDPARPSVSALRRGAHPFAILPLTVGAFLIWIGVVML